MFTDENWYEEWLTQLDNRQDYEEIWDGDRFRNNPLLKVCILVFSRSIEFCPLGLCSILPLIFMCDGVSVHLCVTERVCLAPVTSHSTSMTL